MGGASPFSAKLAAAATPPPAVAENYIFGVWGRPGGWGLPFFYETSCR